MCVACLDCSGVHRVTRRTLSKVAAAGRAGNASGGRAHGEPQGLTPTATMPARPGPRRAQADCFTSPLTCASRGTAWAPSRHVPLRFHRTSGAAAGSVLCQAACAAPGGVLGAAAAATWPAQPLRRRRPSRWRRGRARTLRLRRARRAQESAASSLAGCASRGPARAGAAPGRPAGHAQ